MVDLRPLVASPRPHQRLTPRASQVGDRLHIRLRQVWPDQAERFLAALTDALADLPVAWIDARLLDGVLVVALSGEGHGQAVIEAVEAAEMQAGIDANPWPEHRHGAPVEDGPLMRAAVEVGADVFAFGLGLTLRALRVPRLPFEMDVEALASLVQNVPGLRRSLARWVGRATAEAGAGAAAALTQGLSQNLVGPVAGFAYHTLRLGELQARQQAWLEAEPRLYGPGEPLPPPTWPPERPVPKPPGPTERYAEMSWLASLGTVVATLPLTGNVERAMSVLASGAPKAARVGREAFSSHLGRHLGGQGIVVLRPGSLRVLDQVDTVVVEGRLWTDEAASALVRVATANGLEVMVVGAPARRRGAAGAPDTLGLPTVSADDGLCEVRRLQIAGRVVATVGGRAFGPLAAGDVALGVPGRDGRAPDGADMICVGGLGDAVRVLSACGEARQSSREGVHLSLAGAVVASLLAAVPVAGSRAPRVLTVVDTAALVAVGNAVRHARRAEQDGAALEPAPALVAVPRSA